MLPCTNLDTFMSVKDYTARVLSQVTNMFVLYHWNTCTIILDSVQCLKELKVLLLNSVYFVTVSCVFCHWPKYVTEQMCTMSQKYVDCGSELTVLCHKPMCTVSQKYMKYVTEVCVRCYRQEGQGTTEELRGFDFRRELEKWERSAREKRDKHRGLSFWCCDLRSVRCFC